MAKHFGDVDVWVAYHVLGHHGLEVRIYRNVIITNGRHRALIAARLDPSRAKAALVVVQLSS